MLMDSHHEHNPQSREIKINDEVPIKLPLSSHTYNLLAEQQEWKLLPAETIGL